MKKKVEENGAEVVAKINNFDGLFPNKMPDGSYGLKVPFDVVFEPQESKLVKFGFSFDKPALVYQSEGMQKSGIEVVRSPLVFNGNSQITLLLKNHNNERFLLGPEDVAARVVLLNPLELK